MIGADGDDVEQLQAVQGVGKVPALAIHAVGEHDREAQAQCLQLLDQLDRELRLALEDIARLEARLGLVNPEGQRKGVPLRMP
jgi:hypothetical protein